VVAYNEDHPIFAYYYAWWEPERLGDGLYQPWLMPAKGARSIAEDENLERSHINQARAAGIDGFIVNRSSDLTHLLRLAKGSDFRVSLQVDVAAGAEVQVANFYLVQNDPGLITYEGRPVLFFWQASGQSEEYWNELRARYDPSHHAVWIADGDWFGIIAGEAWDGISPYSIAWSANPAGQLPAWGAKARAAAPDKLYIPPVSPGCDDSFVRSATCVQGRAGGSYYQATLRGALASNPKWAIVVSTWNEWLEATSIEPSVQYGDLYIDLTRQFAESFKT
jgi:hypothetical protein